MGEKKDRECDELFLKNSLNLFIRMETKIPQLENFEREPETRNNHWIPGSTFLYSFLLKVDIEASNAFDIQVRSSWY